MVETLHQTSKDGTSTQVASPKTRTPQPRSAKASKTSNGGRSAASGNRKNGRGRSSAKPQAKRKPAAVKTEKAKPKSGLSKIDDNLAFVLSYPLRVRMLASLKTEGPAAPSDLARRLGADKSNCSYHMKVLLRYNCVEFVEEVPGARGIPKKVYRALVDVSFPKEVWETLPPAVQGMVVSAVFQAQFADSEVALMSGAYEKRPESHASWTNSEVTEPTWHRIIELFDATLIEALEIIEAEKDHPGKKVTASLNLGAFVLPPDTGPTEERVPTAKAKKRLKGKRSLHHE